VKIKEDKNENMNSNEKMTLKSFPTCRRGFSNQPEIFEKPSSIGISKAKILIAEIISSENFVQIKNMICQTKSHQRNKHRTKIDGSKKLERFQMDYQSKIQRL